MSDTPRLPLEPYTPDTPPRIGGATYDPALDGPRLNAQQRRVWAVMRDQKWRTLREIADLTGDPEASVSSRLRDFRKPRFGGYTVERRRRGDEARGIHEYRVRP